MKRVILDSSALLNQPSTVSYRKPDIELLVPAVIAQEVARFRRHGDAGETFRDLLTQASAAGNITVAQTERQPIVAGKYRFAGGATETAVVELAQQTRDAHPNDEVYIATLDKDIANIAAQTGIRVVSGRELGALFEPANQDASLGKRAREVVRRQWRAFAVNIAVGVLAALLTNLAAKYIHQITGTINVWGTVLLIPVAGVGLFWIRSHFRLAYGITECLIGTTAAIRVFVPSFDFGALGAASILQLAGGLYIMVRGLDNIGKSLRGTRFYARWKRLFPD